MGGSYRQCPECGKRALSIATRCPGCRQELPPLEAAEPGPALALGRLLSPKVAAGLLAGAAVVGLATVGRTGHPSALTAGPASASTEVAYAMREPPAEASAEAPPAEAGRLLVARTWTSVRKARSRSAELEAVLLPGDTVLADSLGAGWYRVALEGEVIGYAHRSTLTSPGTPADSSLP